MSPLYKVTHRRQQGQTQAKLRREQNRYLRKPRARSKAERAPATRDLQATQAHGPQSERQTQTRAVRPKVDVVWLSRHRFLEVRIRLRAVGRVLRLLATALGLQKAPCPHTVLNGVLRLSIVRSESARAFRGGGPLSHAPCSNGLSWRIALSIGLGSGKR